MFRTALLLALIATPATASEFKLGLSLDEQPGAITRDAALAATAERRTACLRPEAGSEDCALELVAAAELLATTGAFAEAIDAARGAVTIMVALRGPVHEDTTVVQGVLGSVLLRAGRQDEAEPVLRAALVGLAAWAEPDPELLSDHLMNLAIVLAEQRRLAEAEPLLRRALAVRVEQLPDNRLAIATAHANLGALLERMGRTDDALAAHQTALAMRRDLLKGSDYDLGTTMLNLAETLAHRPDAARLIAEPYLRAGLATREFVLAPGDPRTTLAQTMLAENLEAQGKGRAALEFHVTAYAGAREGSDPDAPLRIRAAWNLARFLTAADTGLPLARTLYREAERGVLTRLARAREFDARARADLDGYRGLFGGEVRTGWILTRTAGK